jgi:hypothetical protein
MGKGCLICDQPAVRTLVEDLASSGGDLTAVRSAIESKSEERISVYQIRKHLCEHSTVDLKTLHESLLVKKKANPEEVALQKQMRLERKAEVVDFLDCVSAINVDEVLSRHNIPTALPDSFEELQKVVGSGAFSLHRSMLGITLAAIDRHIKDTSTPPPTGLVKAAQMSQDMLDKVTGLSAAANLDGAIRLVTQAGFTVLGGDGEVVEADSETP